MLRNFSLTGKSGGASISVAALIVCQGMRALAAQPGTLDTTFDPKLGVDQSVFAIALQIDQKVVIGGDFTTVDGAPRKGVARLLSGGGLDSGFNPLQGPDDLVKLDSGFNPLQGPDDLVNAVAVQGAELIIAGYFTEVNGTPQNYVARLQSNGLVDTNFLSGEGADAPVLCVAVQGDGKLLLGGAFNTFNGPSRNKITRLNQNGVTDFTFNPGTGVSGDASSTVNAIALQSDGKVVIGGSFTHVDGSGRKNLARLTSTGALDPAFAPIIGVAGAGLLAGVYATAIQPDGKILVAGDFTSINETSRTNIARLNTDGSLDSSFNPARGPNGGVNALAIQTNGKIVIGGFFTQVNGTNRNYVARLNPDGSVDNSFQPLSGADDAVYSAVIQPDGEVLIGGFFTSFDGVSRRGIARLHGDPVFPAPTLFNPLNSNNVFRVSVATTAGKSYVLEFKNLLGDPTWTPLAPVAGDGTVKILTDSSASAPSRLYRVRVQ
jgi:uncharacterized delta-60 repeat protein